jgi:hypothetical protein
MAGRPLLLPVQGVQLPCGEGHNSRQQSRSWLSFADSMLRAQECFGIAEY